MAITVTDNHVTVSSFDAQTGIISDDSIVASVGQNDTNFKVQGTGSAVGQFKSAGVGGMGYQYGTAQDWFHRHVYCWLNNLDVIDTDANSGFRTRLHTVGGSGGDFSTNYGEWKTGGRDTRRVFIDRFVATCVDVMRPYDFSGGTAPNRSSARSVSQTVNATTGSGQSTWYLDEIKYGSTITVKGGSDASPGTSAQISNDATTGDEADGRGVFKNVSGAFYILTGINMGDITNNASYFRDTRQTWVFEGQAVAGDFYTVSFVGHGTPVNQIRFGTSSGTGTAKEGSGGNTFLSAGEAPFHFDATDSDCTAEFYGCTLVGPTTMRDEYLRNFKVLNGAAYTDDTQDFNDSDASDAPAFVTPANGDACLFGHNVPFYQLKLNIGTAKSGSYTITWEYYNGSSWQSLTDVADGTNGLTTTGTNIVSFAIPSDWASATFDTDNRYWVRAAISSYVSSTTIPSFTQGWCGMIGDVVADNTNVEFIRCTFAQMGSVKISGSAKLKKSIITNTITPPKHAALNLGSSDPTTDTVRDLTIQNSARGILLNPTGSTTYNFRNLSFSGNSAVSAAIQEDATPAGFVDETTDANSDDTADITIFPATSANGDNFYVGYHSLFNRVRFTLSTAGSTNGIIVWQYYNGSTWSALTSYVISDGTGGLETPGTNDLTFKRPGDWDTTSVNSQGPYYYIRANVTTGFTTNPIGTRIRAGFDVRVDAPGGSTVTINILGGGSSISEDDIENVNSSTIVINNNVTVTVTVQDGGANAIVGAQVAIFKTSDDSTLLSSTPTGADGTAVASVGASTGATYIRVRQSTNYATFDTSQAFTTNILVTDAVHSFVTGEAVTYDKDGGTAAVGLTDSTVYYVRYQTTTSVTIHDTAAHAIANTDIQTLTTNGSETHKLDPIRYIPTSTVATVGTDNVGVTVTMVEDTTVTG